MPKSENPVLSFLTCRERWLAALISLGALLLFVCLIFFPPAREAKVTSSKDGTTTTSARSDQTTVCVSLLTASAALLFYAINGLRMTKFGAGPISAESAPSTGSLPPDNTLPDRIISVQRAAEIEPSGIEPPGSFNSLGDLEKKILRTLWRYQMVHFPDLSARWTFKLRADSDEYPNYLIALGNLMRNSLASVNPANDQCALTSNGIILMRSLAEDIKKGTTYTFV